MSDESFFREVNEEIRHDRTRALWARFGRGLIALAVVAVVATGATVAWRSWQTSKANASGDRYLAALDVAAAGNLDDAVTQLEAIAGDAYGTYPNLARLRLAGVQIAKSDPAGAVKTLDGIADDAKTPKSLRDIATVRAAYILLDTGSLDDVRGRVERLSGDAEPLRFAAREALGLASWKAGQADAAKGFFEGIRNDGSAPAGIALRAGLMLELIAGGSTPPSADAVPVAADAVPASPAVETPVATPAQPLAPAATPESPAPAPAAPATADQPAVPPS